MLPQATFAVPTSQPALPNETPPEPALASESPQTTPAVPLAAMTPVPSSVPLPVEPSLPVRRKGLARFRAALLIGLVILVVAGGILGSLSLLARLGVVDTASRATIPAVRGGTWTDDLPAGGDPSSLIPNSGGDCCIDQALYLPLFYGDAQGQVHPGAAREIPTVQNGDISADATTWTFHLRPHLVWSDGQPYDARDVDYTWRLWLNPRFGAANTQGYDLITQAFASFLSLWVDGSLAPLPAHHFSRMAPESILKSPDNLNPQVVSGPFLLSERVPGDHYTLVRNPRYYLVRAGLPYLDKVVLRITNPDALLKDLRAGSIDSAWFLDLEQWQAYERLKNYTLVTDQVADHICFLV
jgi:peptide/nickel transport system substrate-binding protein